MLGVFSSSSSLLFEIGDLLPFIHTIYLCLYTSIVVKCLKEKIIVCIECLDQENKNAGLGFFTLSSRIVYVFEKYV